MPAADLVNLTLTEAVGLVAGRKVSPLELAEAFIARSQRLDPKLNAYITPCFDTALAEAKAATAEIAAGKYRGPLHGIPFALKDLYATAGVRTTAGSKLRENYVPAEDAYVVTRLKEAGAVFLGKLNMHEWALGGTNINVWYGTPRNPWDLTRLPGGSSGGSGVAVAAGLCLGSLGSDTRGSIRIPASLCGISGLKPTYGRVSLRGVVPLNWSLDHAGPMARTAQDCALILQSIAGFDDQDPTSVDVPVPDFGANLGRGIDGLRVGVPANFFFDEADVEAEVLAAVRESGRALESLGAKLLPVEFPDLAYQDNGAFLADAATYHEENVRDHPEEISPVILTRFRAALDIRAVDYSRARYRQLELKLALRKLFREVDLLLTPTMPVVAPRIPDDNRDTLPAALLTRNTGPFNTAGIPVVSVPCGFSSDGLPIGLSLAGRAWEEGLVLQAAHAYQQATDWHKRRPALD